MSSVDPYPIARDGYRKLKHKSHRAAQSFQEGHDAHKAAEQTLKNAKEHWQANMPRATAQDGYDFGYRVGRADHAFENMERTPHFGKPELNRMGRMRYDSARMDQATRDIESEMKGLNTHSNHFDKQLAARSHNPQRQPQTKYGQIDHLQSQQGNLNSCAWQPVSSCGLDGLSKGVPGLSQAVLNVGGKPKGVAFWYD